MLHPKFDVDSFLEKEADSVREEMETVLRQMCFGRNHREWSDDLIEELLDPVLDIMDADIRNQLEQYDEDEIERLAVDEDMMVTAMMVYTMECTINKSIQEAA